MKITLERLNDAVHFEAKNEEGIAAHFDGSPDIGGEGKGIRPMEGVLMSLAGCSAIDVVGMLQKMRQEVTGFRMEVTSARREQIPRVFTEIHIRYLLTGNIEQEKAERAAKLSADKYCSVSKMLEPTIEISHSVVINP